MSTNDHEPSRPDDVIGLLVARHDEIRQMFDLVGRSTGTERWDMFTRLVGIASVHEALLEMVLRPHLEVAPGGPELADELVEEERRLKELSAQIESAGPEDPNIDARLLALREGTFSHLAREEREAHPALRDWCDADELTEMERALRAVESVIPFDPAVAPAPGQPSNPVAAVLERVRAVIRRATRG